MQWNLFEVQSSTDFSDDEVDEFPELWSTIGNAVFKSAWPVIADGEDRVLDHQNNQAKGRVAALVWHGGEKNETGVLKAGKRYRMKIVVGDARDLQRDSIVLLEESGILAQVQQLGK